MPPETTWGSGETMAAVNPSIAGDPKAIEAWGADGPARAVRCALALREALSRLGLEIRAGLHTGEVELRGESVAGIGVHIAARVMAAPESSDVLVSRTVKDLVVGSGLEFVDQGSHHLKGVPGEWQLFRAVE